MHVLGSRSLSTNRQALESSLSICCAPPSPPSPLIKLNNSRPLASPARHESTRSWPYKVLKGMPSTVFRCTIVMCSSMSALVKVCSQAPELSRQPSPQFQASIGRCRILGTLSVDWLTGLADLPSTDHSPNKFGSLTCCPSARRK
jgi:hypothetical protein